MQLIMPSGRHKSSKSDLLKHLRGMQFCVYKFKPFMNSNYDFLQNKPELQAQKAFN